MNHQYADHSLVFCCVVTRMRSVCVPLCGTFAWKRKGREGKRERDRRKATETSQYNPKGIFIVYMYTKITK